MPGRIRLQSYVGAPPYRRRGGALQHDLGLQRGDRRAIMLPTLL